MHVPVHIPIRLYLQYLINKLYMYWMYNHYKMSDYAIMVLDLTLPLDKEPLKKSCPDNRTTLFVVKLVEPNIELNQ